jgi:hypothetical protein
MSEHHRSAPRRRSPQQLVLPLAFSGEDCPSQKTFRGSSTLNASKGTSASVPREARPRETAGRDWGGATWRRIIDQGVRFGLVNPQLGTEIGRLAFHGKITLIEAETASIVAEIYHRYERSLGLRRSPASSSFMTSCDLPDFAEESQEEVLRARRAKRHYEKLQKAIPSPRARAILEQLCVDDHPIGPIDLRDARILLRRLAVLFWGVPH